MATWIACFCGALIRLDWGTHYQCAKCGRISSANAANADDQNTDNQHD